MTPFKTATGIAVAMLIDDMNTDQIAPIQMSRQLKPDYGSLLFKRARTNPDGTDTDHILNEARYRNPTIFLGGRNFACGSSREAAVWCMMGVGVKVIVARSIADIFRENCLQNGLLPIELDDSSADDFEKRVLAADGKAPFTVDLQAQKINGPGGGDIAFEISASDKMRLIEGLDDIGFTMKHDAEIKAWEEATRAQYPWRQALRDKRVS